MKEIIILLIKAAISFGLSIVLLIIAAAKKRDLFYVGAAIAFLLSVGFGGYAGYMVIKKAKSKVTETVRPRTGTEIYQSLLGKPQSCVKVLQHQDQIVPRLDVAIWLHFETCPAEMERVLNRQTYTVDTVTSDTWKETRYGGLQHPTWWQPQKLGNTIIVYDYKANEYTDGQAIYLDTALTQGYLIDVLD